MRFRIAAAWFRSVPYRRLVTAFVEGIGALWIIVEAYAFFGAPEKVAAIRGAWWAFLLAGGAVGLWRARPRLRLTRRISGTDADLTVRVGDVFDTTGDIIVGTNTTFDTALYDGTIHPRSIQGRFTLDETSVDALDRDIDHALARVEPVRELAATDKPFGRTTQYPIGTVATVRGRTRRAHFVAIATFGAQRVANSTTEDILAALPAIWEHVRSHGDMDDIVIPVLGSGFSRVRATRGELIAEIIRSFVAAAREGRFCEHLTIVIWTEDFAAGRVKLQTLERILDHECNFFGTQVVQSGQGRTSVPAQGRGNGQPIDPPPAELNGVPTEDEPRLSDDQATILRSAASADGTVIRTRTRSGLIIQAGGDVLNEVGDSSSEAQWEAALITLWEADLLSAEGLRDEVYRLTALGWQLAARIGS